MKSNSFNQLMSHIIANYWTFFFAKDAPVQAQVRQALARPRVAHALRPSSTSAQRVVGDLRSTKWSTRREARYRVISSLRSGISEVAEQQQHDPQTESANGAKEKEKTLVLDKIQVVDLMHENTEEEDRSSSDKVSFVTFSCKFSLGGKCSRSKPMLEISVRPPRCLPTHVLYYFF